MRVAREGADRRWLWVLLIVAGSVVGILLSELGGRSDPVAAADAAPSYELFDLDIQYPYVDPRDEYMDDPPIRANLAGVSYATHWTGSSYPGLAKCAIVLRGTTGAVVGRVDFGVTSGMAETPATDFWPQVEVSAPPTSATGSCADSVYPPGSGYAFERPEISRPTDPETGRPDASKTRLSFRSRWVTSTDPATRSCSVIVRFEDGRTGTYGPLNVRLAQGEPLVTERPIVDPSTIQDAEVHCSELNP